MEREGQLAARLDDDDDDEGFKQQAELGLAKVSWHEPIELKSPTRLESQEWIQLFSR